MERSSKFLYTKIENKTYNHYLAARERRIRFLWRFSKSSLVMVGNVVPSHHKAHILPLWYFCPNISPFFAISLVCFETTPKKNIVTINNTASKLSTTNRDYFFCIFINNLFSKKKKTKFFVASIVTQKLKTSTQ